MNFKDIVSGWLHPDEVQHVNWKTFAQIIRTSDRTSRPISVEGYLRKADKDGFVLVSDSTQTEEWLPVPVSRISELLYFGQESLNEGASGRVRLTL